MIRCRARSTSRACPRSSTGSIRSSTGPGTRQPPTATHRRQLELAEGGLEAASGRLDEALAAIAAIEEELAAAGAPWTPGREIELQGAPWTERDID
ncbi:MAG: hypothetical protein R2991_08430 [Thermoanaerobaculia bacterium]